MNIARVLKPVAAWLAAAALLLTWIGVILYFVFWENRWYAAFGSDEYHLGVIGSTMLGEKYVYIEVEDPHDIANVVLGPQRTDQVLRMFEAAKARQSSAWHEVGTLTEDREDWTFPAHLTVSAGPGIRFVIQDHGTCLSYDLAPADFAAFERAALRARRHFDSDDVDRGLMPDSDAPASAFQGRDAASGPIPSTNLGCR